jgi:FlaA1/EpsC-like NDP-sugar epimerase
VLPPVSELLDGRVSVGDIRPLTEADLLGRHQVETDVASIADYLAGRRVLVTGAGGSIGSELCRQLAQFDPATLVMLDRDESALHDVQLSIRGHAPLDTPDLVVADIRDHERLVDVFERHRPEVVFHAAALKHVPLLELNPHEAVKTNVLGTQHLLDAAITTGVDRFITISTDKAADPVNVLGYTKRITERLTADAALRVGKPYLSVRFGNVLGSRGSVLDTFRAQIDAGGPVTVTDPDVTRFFMTVGEAVELTIQAGAIGEPGEALVLDMGEPVRIAELAQRLVDNAGRPIDIVHTGLRPGDKLHEVRLASGEADTRRHHPLISHVDVPPLPSGTVAALVDTPGETALRRCLAELSCNHVKAEREVVDAAVALLALETASPGSPLPIP